MKSFTHIGLCTILLGIILLLSYPANLVAQVTTINGRNFEKQNGKWFQIQNGYAYEVDSKVITVKYKKGISTNSIYQYLSQKNITVIRNNELGFVDLEIPNSSDPLAVVQDFINSGLVEIAEPNTIGEYVAIPNDPYFSNQWSLNNTGQSGGTVDADIDAVEAWDIEPGDPSVIIGILDSGTDWTHWDIGDATQSYQNLYFNPGEDAWKTDPITGQWRPDSANHIDDDGNGFVDDWIGWDFGNNNNDSRGTYFHGTHVAGIAAAKTNNGTGIAGVAGGWGAQGSRLMILGVGDSGPIGAVLDDAILYAAAKGAKVLTMSLTVGQTSAIDAALQTAYQTYGCFIDCASGNNGSSVSYPANNQYVVAVGATDRNDIRPSWSNYGPNLDITAPGVDIYSTTLNNSYTYASGTSMAAPHVAGVAALVWSSNPSLTNLQVEQIIEQTADDKGTTGFDNYYGYGRVNAYKSIKYTLENYGGTIFSTFTIPSGETWNFHQNVTINLRNYVQLRIYGTLNSNGATFQGNGSPGYWHSIYFYANSSGNIQNSTIKDAQCGIYANQSSNLTISNSTIENNSLYGMSLISTNPTISSCIIQNNGTGINSSSSRPYITGCTIENNSNYGIKATNISSGGEHLFWNYNTISGNGYAVVLNNASPYLHNNVISNNGHGVVINSSYTNFADPSNNWRGYNAITCGATPLFRAENYSVVYAGYGFDGGYNSIFGSELPDMEARNHSQIYACNNYWGSPYPAIYADGTSTILAWYPLSEDPNPGSCEDYLASSFVENLSSDLSLEDSDVADNYWEAVSNGREGNFQKAKKILKQIIEGKFNHKYSPLALLSFYEFAINESIIKNQSGYTDSLNYDLNDILMEVYNRVKEDSLRPFAIRLLARETALANNYDKMISYNTELINDYPNTVNELPALYDLVTYYIEIEQDTIKSKEYFTRMVEEYLDEDLTKFASIDLGVYLENIKKELITTTEQIPKEYYLSNAYPNPFNPTTQIKYSIKEDGLVILKVYDILGREITTLVNEVKPAGNYIVNFNASNLSSGVYFYSIKAGSFYQTKKMILMR